jgi:hypothetical protein
MKPYAKAQTIKYSQEQDKRRKLTDEQRAEILRLHEEKKATYRGLAKQFGVSRRLITFICDPESARKNKEHIASTWRLYRERRGKKENARIAREFKNRKYKMYMNGELTEKPNTKGEKS